MPGAVEVHNLETDSDDEFDWAKDEEAQQEEERKTGAVGDEQAGGGGQGAKSKVEEGGSQAGGGGSAGGGNNARATDSEREERERAESESAAHLPDPGAEFLASVRAVVPLGHNPVDVTGLVEVGGPSLEAVVKVGKRVETR
jgi:hypothetical protein